MDRYVGVPVVAVAGAVRRRRPVPAQVERIGLLKLAAIGDTILLGGVVSDVSSAFPDAQLFLFVGATNAAAARLLDVPAEVVVVPTADPRVVVRELRQRALDVLVDFGSWSRVEALCAAFSHAAFSVGFRTPGQFRHSCQDASVDHSDLVHEIENYRRVVTPLGVRSGARPRLRAPGGLGPDRLPGQPYVVLHPWPSGFQGHLKEWPNDRWSELARWLAARDLGVVLSGGPADVGRSAALAKMCGPSVVDVAGRFDLGEVLDLVLASSCVISVNTGVMHLAATAGAPTVCLNGPTSNARWGPIGEHVKAVSSTFDGCGYLNLGGEYRGRRRDCMLGISVDEVIEATLEVMKRSASGGQRWEPAHG